MQERRSTAWIACAILIWAHLGAAPVALAEEEDVREWVQVRVDHIRNGGSVTVAGQHIASSVVLPDFYERRDFEPAWTNQEARQRLLAAIRGSEGDGLLPRDYHLASLEGLANREATGAAGADFDLLATDAVIRLAYHLRFGKVDPAAIDPDWNFRPDIESALRTAPAVQLQQMLERHELEAGLAALRPTHRMYGDLRAALARYRALQAAGGWQSVPAGPTLRPGQTDARVPGLRQRLRVEGDLASSGATPASADYDSTLVTAVRKFQARHGLTDDGLVGRGTLAALNVSCATRVNQIRAALERGRLVLHDLPPRFVLVNVAGFRVYYTDENGTNFAANCIVGKPFTRTPIFKAEMTSVVLNPSWTIPPGIMERDVEPGMRRDPNYLQSKGYKRVGDQIVQPPGPNNALGRIKLMFPNPHLVYLHDTPQRDLFERDARSFSSGCIRVQNVIDLAVLVLGDPAKWSKAQVEAALSTGKTRTIPLARPVPVLLTYWTAAVAPGSDEVQFYDDLYRRDPALLRALDGPFRFDRSVVSRSATLSRR